jgi:hypothetical protein
LLDDLPHARHPVEQLQALGIDIIGAGQDHVAAHDQVQRGKQHAALR